MSKFSDWIKKYLGKKVDFDKMYGAQCFDWFNRYATDLFGVPTKLLYAHSYAYQLYTNFNMGDYFTKIANTASFVPQVGDVCIWDKSLNGYAGHVAIATGEGNTKYFYVTEQNTDGTGTKPSAKVKRNYNHFLGVLRPKNQSVFKDPDKTAIGTILVVNRKYKITTKSGLKIRSGAGTNYSIVGSAAKGKSYKLIEFLKVGKDIWGKISSKHWICVSQSGTLYVNATGTTTAALNYRSGTSTNEKILGTFKKGTKLTFTKTSGSWGYVSGKGWVSLNYVK